MFTGVRKKKQGKFYSWFSKLTDKNLNDDLKEIVLNNDGFVRDSIGGMYR